MSSGFTEHLPSLTDIVLPLGPTAVSIGPATRAHTGSKRTACAGPLLPTVPCPAHFALQHGSHTVALLGVTNSPGLSSRNNGLPQFYINTAQQKHPRMAT